MPTSEKPFLPPGIATQKNRSAFKGVQREGVPFPLRGGGAFIRGVASHTMTALRATLGVKFPGHKVNRTTEHGILYTGVV